MENLIQFFLLLPIFMMAVVIHEVSHGWVALYLGDPTARLAGRLTLNPLKHIDPMGTVVLPLLLIFLKSPFVFGWAKPVPVNPMLLRRPRRDMIWVGMAGPAANFFLASVAAFFLHFLKPFLAPVVVALVFYGILINLVLGVFNLLPIPPLDGSRVLAGILPLSWARRVWGLERWGIWILLALLTTGVIRRIVFPTAEHLAALLGFRVK